MGKDGTVTHHYIKSHRSDRDEKSLKDTGNKDVIKYIGSDLEYLLPVGFF